MISFSNDISFLKPRNKDEINEATCASFLDRFFYPRLPDTRFMRMTDQGHQFKGLDVLLSVNGKTLGIDEKAKLNNALDTITPRMAFELSFINKAGRRQIGWFLNKTLETTTYSLISAFTSNGVIDRLSVLLVSKRNLKADLILNGITEDLLESHAFDKNHLDLPGMGFIHCSTRLDEQPVNLVLETKYLESVMSSRRYDVTKSGIQRII